MYPSATKGREGRTPLTSTSQANVSCSRHLGCIRFWDLFEDSCKEHWIDMGATESTEASKGAESSDGNVVAQDYATPSALVICGPSGVGKGTLIKGLMENSESYAFSCSHTTREPRPGEQVTIGENPVIELTARPRYLQLSNVLFLLTVGLEEDCILEPAIPSNPVSYLQAGVHYHFVARERMEKAIKEGLFLEYAYVHRHIYGTSHPSGSGNSQRREVLRAGYRRTRRQTSTQLWFEGSVCVCCTPFSMNWKSGSEAEGLRRRNKYRQGYKLQRKSLRGKFWGFSAMQSSETTVHLSLASQPLAMHSLSEEGLYDYVVYNDLLDESAAQLAAIAQSALEGKVGNGKAVNLVGNPHRLHYQELCRVPCLMRVALGV